MKNTIVALSLFSFLAFSSCKKGDSPITPSLQTNAKEAEKLVVDSVKINDSVRINNALSVNYSAKLLVFPEIKDQKLLDSIYFRNQNISDFSKQGLQDFLQKEKEDFFKDRKGGSYGGDAGKWYSHFDMNLKNNINDFMHIEYSEDSYFGGAHGSFDFFERVFDLRANTKVTLGDITTISEKDLGKLLMKNFDKVPSGAAKPEGKNSDMLLVKDIPVTDNFYFDDENLYFRYNSYAIASYAAGDITIPVSWEDLKGTLKPEFKERMKIK